MDAKPKATTSRRWTAPEHTGDHWTARLVTPLDPPEQRAGLESVVYGPDAAACVRETVRQDREWAAFPLRRGDSEGARRRLAYLAGGEAE